MELESWRRNHPVTELKKKKEKKRGGVDEGGEQIGIFRSLGF